MKKITFSLDMLQETVASVLDKLQDLNVLEDVKEIDWVGPAGGCPNVKFQLPEDKVTTFFEWWKDEHYQWMPGTLEKYIQQHIIFN